jgi:hypothetical protein
MGSIVARKFIFSISFLVAFSVPRIYAYMLSFDMFSYFFFEYRQSLLNVFVCSIEDPRPIMAGETHPMTFSVVWQPTKAQFIHRFDRYLDFDFFEHQV